MFAATRLLREVSQLRGLLAPSDFMRYTALLAVNFPAIVRARSLVPADRRMLSTVTCSVRDVMVHIPVDEITRLLDHNDTTPTFGGIREMYGSNVYLRPFPRNLTVETAIDLGSNRGLFSVLAAMVLKATTVIGVEPEHIYEQVFHCLLRANGLEEANIHRVTAFAASVTDPRKITVSDLMRRYGITRIGFLKCDTEGAEFDLFLRNNDFLADVDHVAMELHHLHGDARLLESAFSSFGFFTRATDQFGRPVPIGRANYFYAARDPFEPRSEYQEF